VRTEGAILPVDLLERITSPKPNLPGLDPDHYHLDKGERINEAANQAWSRLKTAWANFQIELGKLSETDPATTVTRERWLLPLFNALGYGRLQTTRALEVGDRSYAISHGWENTPIHLVGARVRLDTRTPGVKGAAGASPHALMQELLNRSEQHLWGFVSNGLSLRVLRDNASLTRQAYLEFDLEAMMKGEVYADFALLWLVCHQSRVEALDGSNKPDSIWLERWSKAAQEFGTRALENLRDGVEEAINALGQGFISHPANHTLRSRLRTGKPDGLDKQDYYRQLLRLVYRMIFLFVAEDRNLLLDPDASPEARETYNLWYSLSSLRTLAEKRAGSKHPDGWRKLRLVYQALGSDEGSSILGLPALGSFLFSNEAAPDLENAELQNQHLLKAVHSLAFIKDKGGLRSVDYKNLKSEELGSIYEALLELHPELNLEAGTFSLSTASGNERKTSGSYYTPESLVQQLLNTALDPVLDEAASQPNPEQAILNLKVCDPACGSGHFLIAAAHRMAKRLASIQSNELEPSPEATRAALRQVIGHCVYGVDINPMAVELCKVSLWMEALEPGKPLSFLEHHIQVGNSLLGTTPKLLKQGIPDDAFTAIEGDDKAVVTQWKKENKLERKQAQDKLEFGIEGLPQAVLSALTQELEQGPDDDMAGVKRKSNQFERIRKSRAYRLERLIADAWCAAFVWPKKPGAPRPITEDTFRKLWRDIKEPGASLPADVIEELERLRNQYAFFHWHVAFPDVFRVPGSDSTAWPADQEGQTALFGSSTPAQLSLGANAKPAEPENDTTGWTGGFDVVLGNPPWERVKLQEKEWFAERKPEIANASNASARRKLIDALQTQDAELWNAFNDARRAAEGESHLLRSSDRFPLAGRGDINTYAVFAESMRQIMGPTGRVGVIVPSGIATDDTTKLFFRDLVEVFSLSSLYDFENAAGVFSGVHRSYKFCLLTLTGILRPALKGATYAFFLHNTTDLNDTERLFTLSSEDIALLNPDSRTCPIIRSKKSLKLLKFIYENGVSIETSDWSGYYIRLLDMGDDVEKIRFSRQFDEKKFAEEPNNGLEISGFARLFEAKMIHLYDHRYADFRDANKNDLEKGNTVTVDLDRKTNPFSYSVPRYWFPINHINDVLTKYKNQKHWLLGYRDITNSTNERTCIVSAIPLVAAPRNTLPCIGVAEEAERYLLIANLSSYILDFVARQKVAGSHLSYGVLKQLPILPFANYKKNNPWSSLETTSFWILPRVLELTYTAWDLEAFAQDCGYTGSPFKWDEERRFLIRCELDAAYFHLYGINRDDTDYILETFPIVKRKDEAKHGEYRTKRVILEIYDAMLEATQTGVPYQTRLDPPPADPSVAHPPRSSDVALTGGLD
jgi:hypothetical protein